jgi:hypothetical protein
VRVGVARVADAFFAGAFTGAFAGLERFAAVPVPLAAGSAVPFAVVPLVAGAFLADAVAGAVLFVVVFGVAFCATTPDDTRFAAAAVLPAIFRAVARAMAWPP